MYYRYEARIKEHRRFSTDPGEWVGIFQIFDPSQRRKWYCLYEPKITFLVCAGISVAFDSHAVIAETNEILDAKKTAYDCLEYGSSFPVIYDTIMVDDPVDERIESVKIRWKVFYRNVYVFYRYEREV